MNILEFIQLNHVWNAEPNSPDMKLQVAGLEIILSFYMNAFQYENFDEDDIGTIVFHDCLLYRLGSPSDEGFFIYGQDRYKQHGIKWGEFYLIKDSDWQINFPEPKMLRKGGNLGNANHYLFYFRDETFECIAGCYDFSVSKQRP